jgi:hypothetical protein
MYLDLMCRLGVVQALRTYLDGDIHPCCVWKPSDIVSALLVLNLSGGDNVDDLKRIQADSGFHPLFAQYLHYGLTPSERSTRQKAMEAQGSGSVPSASTVLRFLKRDGTDGLEGRGQGHAHIPECGETAQQLAACNKALLGALYTNKPCESITLDMDATLIETHKEDALYGYKGYRAYQPMNVWWAEQRVMLYTQFRDGNVNANYDLLPVLKQALSCLPESDKPKFFRSDTAGYTMELLKFCDDEHIGFAVGCPIKSSLRHEIRSLPAGAWHKLDDKREYAEVCYVPSELARAQKGKHEFRYIATRELICKQHILPGLAEPEYPFPTERLNGLTYKIHAVVTNRVDMHAVELIQWYYKRCGNSEEAHAVLKNDLAGGILPCDHFHANANWWWIAVIAHNIHSAFKVLCCGESWLTSRLKRMRFHIINIPGRVLLHGRELYIRLNRGDPANALFASIRQALSRLRPCPV